MMHPLMMRGAAAALGLLLAAAAPAATADTPPTTQFIFEEVVLLAPDMKVGKTPFGNRNIVPIIGGTFEGPGIKGTIIPGGWDWQLGAEGCFRLEANYMLRTDDNVIINILNRGTACQQPGQPATRLITAPSFEAPVGRYGWLNDGAYLGTLDVAKVDGKPAVKIRIYKAR
ncbi:DUF3237 domain-containing protein [Sphingomonas sp.]|uniref:DUF3237 domain-containing protein n=1 Tax=Sphingomonas sp. TaxID=28214 RepID=UPI003B3A34AB